MHLLQASDAHFTAAQPLASSLRHTDAARDLPELLAALSSSARSVTGAQISALALRTPDTLEVRVAGTSEVLIDRYLAFLASGPDPLRGALTRTGVVRTSELFSTEAWRAHPFFRQVLEPFGVSEVMVAYVPDAEVEAPRGAIAVARAFGAHPFSAADALSLQVLCLHTSLALLRLDREATTVHLWKQLTPKQQQLTRMVANGLTNEQIARASGITIHAVKKALERMFARFHVASRAELIATLGVRAG